MEAAKQIAEILLRKEAVKVKMSPPFTWTSGIKSPVYCDNRKLISYPKERKIIVEAFRRLLYELDLHPDYIGGTATAAIPWAAFLAYETGLPMIYIRPEKKEHGASRQVEGDLPQGKRVLILEDLISTGGSSVAAAEAIKNECQGVVTDIFAIVTWELEEAKKKFLDKGLRLTALTNFTNIIGVVLEKGQITKEEWEQILDFKKNPRAWAKNFVL